MKKRNLIPLSILMVLAMSGCGTTISSSTNSNNGSAYDYNSSIEISDPEDVSVTEVTGDFSLTTEDGTISQSGSVYKLTSAGTYVAEGKLTGQILIEAASSDDVVLELNGVSIDYSSDSPIKAISANKVEISAKKDTGNIITDYRSAKQTDNDSQGEGAISSDTDLKLKGTGTLVVTGNYNNGVHTTKDLTVQKETLKVTAVNNALKGNNSVTIESGSIQLYSTQGDGIKTEDTDVSTKGNQKGSVTLNGGDIYIDALHDAVDAAYNVELNDSDVDNPLTLNVKTGTKSSVYNKSTFKADSEKGLKAANEIIVNGGTASIAASDDAIHANYGTSLENGSKGQGNITINDGLVQIASGDDGLHADNTININGGKTVITGSKEGIESNYINVSGGYTYVYGTDDGVNCSKKSFSTCKFVMSGGYLDVAVSSGDTDGIDSNGDVLISGGTIITRGSPGTSGSNMSTGLDVDGTCSMSGGTLIAFNNLEKSPSTSSSVLYAGTASNASGGQGGPGGGGPGGWKASYGSSYTFNAGNYTLSGDNLSVSFTNDYNYGSFLIYSSSLKTGSTYTLSLGSSTVLSWTQSSSNVTIS